MKRDDIQLVIFDMDGTMFDTEKIAFQAWKEAASQHGYEITMEMFHNTLGSNAAKIREFYLSRFGPTFPIEDIYKSRIRIGEEHIHRNGVPIKDGLFELLEYLVRADIKRAVATSTGRERAVRMLEAADAARFFHSVICGDEVERSKPDPQIYLKTAESLNCNPERCLVLEDSEAGIAAAKSAGMLPVMIPDMKVPSDAVRSLIYRELGSLRQVIDLFENML